MSGLRGDKSLLLIQRWGDWPKRRLWLWSRSWTLFLKFPRVTWSPQPAVGQVHIAFTETAVAFNSCSYCLTLNTKKTFSSVSDSLHSHGCPGFPGILCVQKHMDEVWIWGGQRLQQVKAKHGISIHTITLPCPDCICASLPVNWR